jgi:redox-sensitive bicupin YhaK (pirin superfamily)
VLAGSAFGVARRWPGQPDAVWRAAPQGAELEIAADVQERAVYVVRGEVTLDGERMEPGTLAILAPVRQWRSRRWEKRSS